MTGEAVNFNVEMEGHIGPDEPCWAVGLPDLEHEGEVALVVTVHNANKACAAVVGRLVSRWFDDHTFALIRLHRCPHHNVAKMKTAECFLFTKPDDLPESVPEGACSRYDGDPAFDSCRRCGRTRSEHPVPKETE